MSIVSKPATKAYSKGWDRAFRKPKARCKWGLVVGQPTKINEDADLSQVGIWCGIAGVPDLYETRAEARAEAKVWEKSNHYWHYHAKKYNR